MRAQQLLELGRNEQAARLLGEYLTTEPDDGQALAWLAAAELELEHYEEATRHAEQAIALEPEWPVGWLVMARVHLHRHRLSHAEAAAQNAIRLNPNGADGFALLGAVQLSRKAWRKAREAADAGLRLEPEHEGCVNVRAMALRQLGERSEAARTLEGQLARTPLDADTHANQAWTLLHSGAYDRAVEHFREALRIDPHNEWAREGIKQALQARSWFYRPVLRFFLWTGRLETRWVVALLVGGYLLYRGALAWAKSGTALAPVLWTAVALYWLFVLATWFAGPLATALLSFHALGRIATTRREKLEAWTVCGLLLAAAALAGIGFGRDDDALLVAGLALAILCLPIKISLDLPSNARRPMLLYCAGMAALGSWWIAIAVEQRTLLQPVRDELTRLVAAEQAIGTGTDAVSQGRRSELRARQTEFSQQNGDRLAAVRKLADRRGSVALAYVVLGFWVSQVVAGIVAHRAALR